MIPQKNASSRFDRLGADPRAAQTPTAAEARAKAKVIDSNILALSNAKRDESWCKSVEKVSKEVMAAPLPVRYYLTNGKILLSLVATFVSVRDAVDFDKEILALENSSTKNIAWAEKVIALNKRMPKPVVQKHLTRLTALTALVERANAIIENSRATQTSTPVPPPRPTPPPPPRPAPQPRPAPRPAHKPNNLGPLLVNLLAFNIPTAVFAILAYSFAGWQNVWMGFAIGWAIMGSCISLSTTMSNDSASNGSKTFAAYLGFALTLAGMIFFLYNFFFGDMLSTTIITWLGIILGGIFMAAVDPDLASDSVRTPATISSIALVLYFTFGIFSFCYSMQIDWLTWVLGILSILVLIIFGCVSLTYHNSDKAFIPFLFIPSYIFAIMGIAGSDSNAYGWSIFLASAAMIITVWSTRKWDNDADLIFNVSSTHLFPIFGVGVLLFIMFYHNNEIETMDSFFFEILKSMSFSVALGSVAILLFSGRNAYGGILATLSSIFSGLLFSVLQHASFLDNGDDWKMLLIGAAFILISIIAGGIILVKKCDDADMPSFLWDRGHIVAILLSLAILLLCYMFSNVSVLLLPTLAATFGATIVCFYCICRSEIGGVFKTITILAGISMLAVIVPNLLSGLPDWMYLYNVT